MALTPQEADNLRKMLLEIERLSKALKENVDTTNLQDLEKSADNIRFIFEKLNKEFKEQNDEISYAAVGFKRIVQEISNANVGLKESNKVYNNLASIASRIQSHQFGISELSSEQLKKEKQKAEIEKQRLENAQELLKDKEKEQKLELENLENLKKKKEYDIDLLKRQHASQDVIKEQQKILDDLSEKEKEQGKLLRKTQGLLEENASIIENQNELYKGLLKTIDEETQKVKNLEKALGLSGAAVDGIGKAFKKAGLGSLVNQMGLDEAKEKMKEVAHQITKGGTKSAGLVGQFKILKAGIGSLGSSIMKNLTDPLVLAGLAAKAVSAGIGLIKKGVGLLSKGFGSVVGFVKNLWGMADSFAAVFEKYAKAGQFAAQNFSAIGAQVGKITAGLNAAAAADPFMRVAEAGPAFKAIVDGTGIMQTQMTKSVKEAHDLSYWLGYSAEETGQLYKLGQLNNQTATDTVTQIKARGTLLNKEHKISLDLRKVEQTALKASAAVKYNLSQNPKALADAAFYATKLNMTLDEIASASEATLNFEQSIQDQLAYQAMSGKELNLDAYQQAALRGDSATAAKELNNLIAEHGDELKGNVLLQDQFAKSIGIGKDKLLEALATQELAAKMGEDRVDIEKGLQFYMSKGLTREEAANKLAKEGLATQLAQSKRAEAMSRALEDFRDYMATRLWPLFKAVFSPDNIKMFMTVINGMRPVFVELGKAITAFFSPDSAGEMSDVLKNNIMPTILDLAKAVTKIAGVFGGVLFSLLDGKIVPLIKEKLLPLVEKISALFVEFAPEIGKVIESVGGGIVDIIGGTIDTIMENKDEIKSWLIWFSDTLKGVLGFAKDNIGSITAGILVLKGFNLMKSAGVFDFAKNVKNVVMGSPGSARNPLYVRSADGGMGGGGLLSKVKGLFGMGGATSFADKREMVAARQAAGKGLASTGASTIGTKASQGAATSGNLLGGAAGNMIKGAGALLILSGALYVAAKAFQEFEDVDWDDMGKAGVALLGLGAAAYILGKAAPEIGIGALAIGALGFSLLPLAAALNLATPGLEALGNVFDKILKNVPPIITAIADGLVRLATEANPLELIALGASLSALAVGVGALGLAAAGAGIADAASSFLGGGGLFSLINSLVELSKVDFKPAAISLKDGILEMAKVGNVDLGPLEDVFKKLEDALDELDLDNLVEFSSLASADLAGAGQKIVEGLNALNVNITEATLLNLDKVKEAFDYIEDIIGELDLDELTQFANLANADLAGAGTKVIEGLNALNVNITGATLLNLDKVKEAFDYIEDIISELDLDELTQFSALANTDLTKSAQNIKLGLDELAKITLDKKGFEQLNNLEDIFDSLEDIISELDLDALTQFSTLANTDLTKAVQNIKLGLDELVKLTGFEQLENVEDIFDALEDVISELDINNLNQFSTISNIDIAKAAQNLKLGLDELVKIAPNADSIERLDEVFDSLKKLSNSSIISQLKELTTIDSSKIITLAEALTKLSESFTGLNGTITSMGDVEPIIKVTDKVIELHDKFSEGPIDQMVNTVKSGVSSLYNQATDFVKSIFQDGAVQVKDGVIQVQDSSLNPNGGLVVSKYQKGQLQPVAQGIKEDNVYFTTNKLSSGDSGGQGAITQNNNAAVVAALDRLTNMMANSSKIVELNIDGKKVGYAVTPTILDTAKKTSVNIS
jgi:hypothetical protein